MCEMLFEHESHFTNHRCPKYVKPYQTPELVSTAPSMPQPVDTNSIDSTLAARGNRYGIFTGHASITQALKNVMYCTDNWSKLSSDQKEALDMIQHKIGRILNGDPDYHDSWHDIVGYAKLVADRLLGRPPQ